MEDDSQNLLFSEIQTMIIEQYALSTSESESMITSKILRLDNKVDRTFSNILAKVIKLRNDTSSGQMQQKIETLQQEILEKDELISQLTENYRDVYQQLQAFSSAEESEISNLRKQLQNEQTQRGEFSQKLSDSLSRNLKSLVEVDLPPCVSSSPAMVLVTTGVQEIMRQQLVNLQQQLNCAQNVSNKVQLLEAQLRTGQDSLQSTKHRQTLKNQLQIQQSQNKESINTSYFKELLTYVQHAIPVSLQPINLSQELTAKLIGRVNKVEQKISLCQSQVQSHKVFRRRMLHNLGQTLNQQLVKNFDAIDQHLGKVQCRVQALEGKMQAGVDGFMLQKDETMLYLQFATEDLTTLQQSILNFKPPQFFLVSKRLQRLENALRAINLKHRPVFQRFQHIYQTLEAPLQKRIWENTVFQQKLGKLSDVNVQIQALEQRVKNELQNQRSVLTESQKSEKESALAIEQRNELLQLQQVKIQQLEKQNLSLVKQLKELNTQISVIETNTSALSDHSRMGQSAYSFKSYVK